MNYHYLVVYFTDMLGTGNTECILSKKISSMDDIILIKDDLLKKISKTEPKVKQIVIMNYILLKKGWLN